MKVLMEATCLAAALTGRAGALAQPLATFKDGVAGNNYSAILVPDIDPAFRGRDWDGSPVDNAAAFVDAFPHSSFDSLRTMIDSVVSDCGSTVLASERVDVSALHSIKWQDGEARVDAPDAHHGPCEAWIDDKRVFRSPDCPAEIPVDFSACHGHCTLRFYWLVLQHPEWEAHKQCVSITKLGERRSPRRRLNFLTKALFPDLDRLFSGKKSEEEQSKDVSSLSFRDIGAGASSIFGGGLSSFGGGISNLFGRRS